MEFEKCRDILLQESELVQQAAALQQLIRNAVEQREWNDFESHFSAMGNIESRLAALEREREELFAVFASSPGEDSPNLNDDKGRFYAFAARLPLEERNELTAIYRGLKLEALKLRLSNETLMAYLGQMRTTIAGFFELAFPDRGGRIYSPQGLPLPHDMRSMVLNRRM
jgi:hypothetical protein